MKHLNCLFRTGLAVALFAPLAPPAGSAELTPAPAAGQVESTNNQDALRAYLQLQEQVHAAQLAIDQARRETDQAAAENAKLLATRLQAIEAALGAQRARELDAMQSSNRVMLVVAGTFAAVGVLGMLLMAFFQWRAVSRLAEISAAMPGWRALGPGHAPAALGPGEGRFVSVGVSEQPNLRLLGALERLEKRIYQLEHTAQPPLPEGRSEGNGVATSDGSPLGALLSQGQLLLDQENPEGALACFEEALKLSPAHAEALVKKGTALERLRRLDEAIQCYDRAIAADNLLTVAYLCKGGLFNRMERFNEALECYEEALRTQEKRAA